MCFPVEWTIIIRFPQLFLLSKLFGKTFFSVVYQSSYQVYTSTLSLPQNAAAADIDAINGQDDVYLEFVPIPDIVQLHTHTHSCKAINFISFDPLQPTIPCQRKCSTIIFLTGCHLLQNIMHSTCMIQVFHFTVYIPTREPIQEMLICVLPWQNYIRRTLNSSPCNAVPSGDDVSRNFISRDSRYQMIPLYIYIVQLVQCAVQHLCPFLFQKGFINLTQFKSLFKAKPEKWIDINLTNCFASRHCPSFFQHLYLSLGFFGSYSVHVVVYVLLWI